MMDERTPYALAMWHVTAGREDEFVRAWSGELAAHFHSLDRPPLWGKLLRSVEHPRLSYSFGPWKSLDDIRAMRADPRSAELLGWLAGMCDEFRAGPYFEVATG
jgi:hypothetical protein